GMAVFNITASIALAPQLFAFTQESSHRDFNSSDLVRMLEYAALGTVFSLGLRWFLNQRYRKTLAADTGSIPQSARHRLLDVPIEGGTPEQRERVRRLLVALTAPLY